MNKQERDKIKTGVSSIGRRAETVILNFFKLLLLSPYHIMPSTELSRVRTLFYVQRSQ
jgi:hypothetical protein